MSKQRILIVDDDIDSGESIQDFLQEEGYDITLVNSGESALEVYDALKFDLVLLDLIMPGMGGVSALERLKQVNPAVKVVLSTGHTFGDEVAKAKGLGLFEIVNKPIDPVRLIEVLQRNHPGSGEV